MKSKEKMRGCKVFHYHALNASNLERFVHLLTFTYSFRNENELLSGTPPLYQNKLLEIDAQGIVNNNKVKFEPYGDLVDESYTRYNEDLINSQDLYGQI